MTVHRTVPTPSLYPLLSFRIPYWTGYTRSVQSLPLSGFRDGIERNRAVQDRYRSQTHRDQRRVPARMGTPSWTCALQSVTAAPATTAGATQAAREDQSADRGRAPDFVAHRTLRRTTRRAHRHHPAARQPHRLPQIGLIGPNLMILEQEAATRIWRRSISAGSASTISSAAVPAERAQLDVIAVQIPSLNAEQFATRSPRRAGLPSACGLSVREPRGISQAAQISRAPRRSHGR